MLYCVTQFQHLESLVFGTDLKSYLSYGKLVLMAKGKRFALGVHLNEKGSCAAFLTLC